MISMLPGPMTFQIVTPGLFTTIRTRYHIARYIIFPSKILMVDPKMSIQIFALSFRDTTQLTPERSCVDMLMLSNNLVS